MEEGRGIDAVERFSMDYESRGGNCEHVAEISMDMSKTYRAAVDLCFPRARVVFDHFHVKKLVLDAMDRVRKEEQGKPYAKSRQAGKKLLMIPETRMTNQQKDRHEALCKAYPKTGSAFRMVQLLNEIITLLLSSIRDIIIGILL